MVGLHLSDTYTQGTGAIWVLGLGLPLLVEEAQEEKEA